MSILVFVSRRPGSYLTSTLDENIEQNRPRGLLLCTWETLRRAVVSPGYGSPKMTIRMLQSKLSLSHITIFLILPLPSSTENLASVLSSRPVFCEYLGLIGCHSKNYSDLG